MARAIVAAAALSLLGCAPRPTTKGAALHVPLRDAVRDDLGEPDVQLRVPAADLAEQRSGPRPANDLEVPAADAR